MTNDQEHVSVRSFYDQVSDTYDSFGDASEDRARRRGIDLLAVQEGERVLEIGYGTGHSLVEIARQVGATRTVAGVDISEKMCGIALQRLRAAGLESRVAMTVAPIPPLPYEDRVFDAVSMSFVLELFPLAQIPIILVEIARILRPRGRVSIVVTASIRNSEHDVSFEHTREWILSRFPCLVDCNQIDVAEALRSVGYTGIEETRIETSAVPVAIVRGIKGIVCYECLSQSLLAGGGDTRSDLE